MTTDQRAANIHAARVYLAQSRRNTYHQYGPEIAQIVQLRGAITRQINRRTSP